MPIPKRSIIVPAAVLAVLVVVLALTAGPCDEKGLGDAPVGEQHEDPREVWSNPDTYPNLTAMCIGANGVYVTTNDAAPAVIVDDPECAEGGELDGD